MVEHLSQHNRGGKVKTCLELSKVIQNKSQDFARL